MAKVYGIYGDNKCKREINTYIGRYKYTKASTSTGIVSSVVTKLKPGVYLLDSQVTFYSGAAQTISIGFMPSTYDDSNEHNTNIVKVTSGNNYHNFTCMLIITSDNDAIRFSMGGLQYELSTIDVTMDLIRLV